MNILYFGDNNPSSTSNHRANALSRLGHNVKVLNPFNTFKYRYFNSLIQIFNYHTGYFFFQKIVLNWLTELFINNNTYDLIWVNSGEFFGVKVLQLLKTQNIPVILYMIDDPTGGRDGNRFNSLLKAIPFYDLCVVVRNENINEFYNIGANKVLRVQRSYDEVEHLPIQNSIDIPFQFKSEVAFIGTWMKNENRDIFLKFLIDSGINISIWGDRWEKSKLWAFLKKYHKGNSLSGKDYVYAIQGAKICIGLLSKGNRDFHTTRSLEIPFASGLLCAQRTFEHIEMYKENVEALFWNDADECVKICKIILNNDSLRNKIKNAGRQRVLKNKSGNEDICKFILSNLINL